MLGVAIATGSNMLVNYGVTKILINNSLSYPRLVRQGDAIATGSDRSVNNAVGPVSV
jgi:hypothetical protein